ncbi:MAG: outer membrane beta-barrel protein [Sphingobacteriales bacterium]|nr:outer membrane beta-barrel protein [Sphingobacteriales bacterium]
MIFAINSAKAQTWWFGVSGAGNLNYYSGTTQRLDNSYFVPKAFHNGTGIKPYGSILMEYNSDKIFGFILNAAYDGRGGEFDDVMAPCNCPATLKTNLSYIALEPSLRINIGNASPWYFFMGPRVGFNLGKDYNYTQLYQQDRDGTFSAVDKTVFSGQIGLGYDMIISSPESKTSVALSPFVSYHPYFGQDPRSIESLSISTARAGIALKFGKSHAKKAIKTAEIVVPNRQVEFSVRAPKIIPKNLEVSETLPLLNYVFFDEGSTAIPSRYFQLSPSEASNFKEVQLQNEQVPNMNGRSSRQMNVYYNILNIIGDRMRENPNSTIDLSGASANGIDEGKLFADEIKTYLVNAFAIDALRITTQGRLKPLIPSEQIGGTKELTLLRQGDRRVDITSNSPALALEVGGGMMKPVMIQTQIQNPLDSHLIFNVDGASNLLKSYTIDVTDNKGQVQHYGPYYTDKESISGKTVLGSNQEGEYTVTMNGITKNGAKVKKVTKVYLARQDGVIEKGYRYSVLFNFDKTKTIASYKKFLAEVVAPLIPSGATVIIHGHTDDIGSVDYNQSLSQARANETQQILENTLKESGINDVKFECYGFGENTDQAPFDNTLPEERFYNRTVVIDIVASK